MNNRLAELIKARHFKEITYRPTGNDLEIKIENDNIKIDFHNEKSCCISIKVKMITKQNTEIYNMIKNELLELHEPFLESVEVVEDGVNEKDTCSFFGISVKKDTENEEMQEVQKEYMYQVLKTVIDSENLYNDILNTIEKDKKVYIIAHGEGGKNYEIFL